MTPDMQSAVLELSTFYHASPDAVFHRVLEIMAARYGRTMAMINLTGGGRIRYRAAVNLHPAFGQLGSISLSDSY